MILVIVVATPSACVVVYTNDCVRLLVGAGVVVLDFSLPGVVGDDTIGPLDDCLVDVVCNAV